MPRRSIVTTLTLTILVGCAPAPSAPRAGGIDAPGSRAPAPGTSDGPKATPGEIELVRADVPRADVAPGDAETAAEGINALGFDLLRLMAAEDGNTVLSPASIAIALGMARAGAEGITAEEMDAVLRNIASPERAASLNALDQALDGRTKTHLDAEGEPRDVTLRIANAPFAQRDMAIHEGYLRVLAESYGAGLRIVDYAADPDGSRRLVNAWVDEETEQRIPELLPHGSVTDLTRLILVNAVYLKAPWMVPFDEEATTEGTFTRADGSTVGVPMMSTNQSLSYAHGDGWQAVDLPYLGGDLSMLLVLPDDPDAFLASVDAETLETVTSTLATARVDLALPRFGIETGAELADPLVALGMPSAFDPDRANFSGITTAERLFISAVIHQANIDVDEGGTEAAAATAVLLEAESAGPPSDTVELRLDRPFLFALRDVQTGAVLFLGTVGDPSAR